MVQLVCVSATDYISSEPECTYIIIILCFMHFIQRSNVSTTEKIWFSGGSKNLRTGGRGPVAVYFFRSGDCFDAPSHMLYAFILRVENEVHTY